MGSLLVELKTLRKEFPSPYGVSFILISVYHGPSSRGNASSFRLLMEYHSFLLKETLAIDQKLAKVEFPSPYGVSFILIYNTRMVNHIRCYSSVSVSLWSIIHSYLRITLCTLNLLFSSDFRLLMELYSFLQSISIMMS